MYKYLEDIATADLAFEVTSNTLEELFVESAQALSEAMVDTKTVEPKVKKEIELENDSVETLLFDFLSEFIFYKDSERLVFSKFDVKIKDNKLKAEIYGEELDTGKHEFRADVKAVTMHMFEVKKTDDGWRAFVIVDI